METTETVNDNTTEKLSISDKLVALFTEPSNLFKTISKTGTSVTDWLIPVILMALLSITLRIVMVNNSALKQQMVEDQIEKVEKVFNQMVAAGKITQEMADTQLEATYEKLDKQISNGLASSFIGSVISTFIFFFIVSSFYIIIMKFILRGKGTYKEGLTAYGLPLYIISLQLIVAIILVLAFNNIKATPDAAYLLGFSTQKFSGYLLSYIDPFKIWFYIVVGIAFAKLYKSENSLKFIIASLGIWIVTGISTFLLAQTFPLLKFLVK